MLVNNPPAIIPTWTRPLFVLGPWLKRFPASPGLWKLRVRAHFFFSFLLILSYKKALCSGEKYSIKVNRSTVFTKYKICNHKKLSLKVVYFHLK